jgi:hypothetical protein
VAAAAGQAGTRGGAATGVVHDVAGTQMSAPAWQPGIRTRRSATCSKAHAVEPERRRQQRRQHCVAAAAAAPAAQARAPLAALAVAVLQASGPASNGQIMVLGPVHSCLTYCLRHRVMMQRRC